MQLSLRRATPAPDLTQPGSEENAPGRRGDIWLVGALALAGFALARLFDLIILRQAAARDPAASVADYLTRWDGHWYAAIAAQGYPRELLPAPNGYLQFSRLAFFPVYPGLVRGVQDVTHLSFASAGVAVNLALGAGAAVVIALVLRPALGPAVAATASVFWSFLPVSPVLMMTYTEALFSVELALFCWLLLRRRYVWLALLMPVIGLSRGTLPPLALVLVVHLVVRWRQTGGRARLRAVATVGGLEVLLGASSALWPAWVGLRTGRLDAYLQIQQAWIRDRGTYASWGRAFDTLRSGVVLTHGAHGLVVVVALTLAALAVVSLFLPMPAELKAVGPVYLVYFVLATMNTPSFFRYMLPVFTFVAVPAMVARARWWPVRVAGVALILVGLAAGQYWWLEHFLVPTRQALTP